MEQEKLTLKQLKFARIIAEERAEGWKAAEMAGYTGDERTLSSQASENLTKPNVIRAIDRRRQELVDATDITPESIMQGFRRIAFGSLKSLYREDGTLKPPAEWTEEEAALVASLETEQTTRVVGGEEVTVGKVATFKVKQWDKVRALDTLAKIFKLYGDKLTIQGNGPGGELTVTAKHVVEFRDMSKKEGQGPRDAGETPAIQLGSK